MLFFRKLMLLLVLFGLTSGIAWAASPQKEDKPASPGVEVQVPKQNFENFQVSFKAEEANKKFDNISLKLSTQDLRLHDIQIAVSEIENLLASAQDCVRAGDAKLNEISDLIKANEVVSISEQQRTDLKYLNDKKTEVATKTSECRLFTFRAQEAIHAFKKTVAELTANQTFERNRPIWEIIDEIGSFSLSDINIPKIIENSGLNLLNKNNLYFFFALFILGVVVGVYIRLRCKERLRHSLGLYPLYDSFLETLQIYVFPILFFGVSAIYLSVIHDMDNETTLQTLSKMILGFTTIIACFRVLLASSSHRSFITGVHYYFAARLYKRIYWVGLLILLGLIVYETMRSQNQSSELISVFYTLYTVVLSFAVYWLLWLFNKHPVIMRSHQLIQFLLKSMMVSLLIGVLIINFTGYHKLVFYILSRLLYTAALLSVLIAVVRLTRFTFYMLNESRNVFLLKVWHSLGVRHHPDLIEIYLIKIAIYLSIYFSAFVMFFKIWSGASLQLERVGEIWEKGFVFAQMTINPSRLIFATFVFSVIHLLTRYTATKITHRNRFDGEKDTQVALASITGYIGFAIAIAAALLASGVDLSGITIIAGALSVGIGLGLQGIVNNFISGIILLLEKPIKPGDRIVFGGIEGFVKKIRIRSTRITTIYNEDIIVPNSELITNKVTNYMYHDRSFLLMIPVEVSYDSDLELVKKILEEIATAHPEVVTTPTSNVGAYLTTYGDSNLGFELYAMIRDVNKKFNVACDLKLSIINEFRKNNIEISYTQRNININYTNKPPLGDVES